MIILYGSLKEEKASKSFNHTNDKKLSIKQDISFFNIDDKINVDIEKREIAQVLAKSSDNIDQELNLGK